jgi:hypothetical protein
MRLSFVQKMPLAGAALIGCALGVWFSGRSPTPELVTQATAAERGNREELDRLLKARYETAKSLLELEEKRLREGLTTLGRVCEVARWVRDSAVELPVGAEERLAALTNYVALTRRLEESVDQAMVKGAMPPPDRERARYVRLDAEVMPLRTELRDSK